MFGSQGMGFFISILLARLLLPEDFGLIGMALVLIQISQVFVDFGFASALIQNQNNTPLTYSSIFYLNVAIGLVVTVLFLLSAPYIGRFYDNTEIVSIVRWLSLIFLFNAFSIVQMAILRKNLDFKSLTIRQLAATVVAGVIGVGMAYGGYGVFALVCFHLSQSVANMLLLWTVSDWKPDFKFSFKEIKRLSGYSTYVFLSMLIGTIFQRLDVVLIGKFFSPATLGFYTRAFSLRNQVAKYSSNSLGKIFFPVLSQLQNDEKQYQTVYFKVISVISFVTFLLVGMLFVMGSDIIVILFGEKWLPSVPYFQILVLSVGNLAINKLIIKAFMSKGKAKENFYISIGKNLIKSLPYFLIYFYGIIEFITGLVIVSYLLTFMNFYLVERYVNLSAKRHFIILLRDILPFLLVIVLFYTLPIHEIWQRIALTVAFALTYVTYHFVLQTEGFVFIQKNGGRIIRKLSSKVFK